jgi:hypothetical protein
MDPDRSDCRDDRDISIIYAIKDQLNLMTLLSRCGATKEMWRVEIIDQALYIWWSSNNLDLGVYTNDLKK